MGRLINTSKAARKAARQWLDRVVEPAGIDALIASRWPWPMRKPWQRNELTLCSASGVGDELMCTAIFREIKRRNPNCRIRFIANHPAMFAGNKDVDQLIPASEGARLSPLRVTYGPVAPPRFPLLHVMGASVGIEPPFPTALVPPALSVSGEFAARVAGIPSPRIVIQTRASKWTPNKDWPDQYWRELVQQLTGRWHVIDTGADSALSGTAASPRYHSFIGQTNLAEFAWLIREASVFVGPVSGGMHIANAFSIPAAIIFGGYEKPEGHFMPQATCFYSAVECAPCWLNDNCPHGKKCLASITPPQVFSAVSNILAAK